jgi:peptidyl-prolyl cis-trans isomerase C
MKKTFAFTLASALLLAMPAVAQDKSDAAPAKDYVILKVDGTSYKYSEVENAWKTIFQSQGRDVPPMDGFGPKVKEKFLSEFASEQVLYGEAQKEGLADSPDVKAELEKVKHQLIIQELLKQKTRDAVSDDKLKAAYDEHLKDSQSGDKEEIHARHILVKTKEDADAVEKKLKSGVPFEKLAKEESQDKGSGASGGDLGWFTPDKMVPEFSKALLKLKKGEISPPVKTDFGWHVIQLEDRRKATPPPFDEVKDTLKQEVGNKAVSDYVKSLMTNVKLTEVDANGQEKSIPSVPVADAPKGKDDTKDDSKDAPADQ